jgi:hypothetical protein
LSIFLLIDLIFIDIHILLFFMQYQVAWYIRILLHVCYVAIIHIIGPFKFFIHASRMIIYYGLIWILGRGTAQRYEGTPYRCGGENKSGTMNMISFGSFPSWILFSVCITDAKVLC